MKRQIINQFFNRLNDLDSEEIRRYIFDLEATKDSYEEHLRNCSAAHTLNEDAIIRLRVGISKAIKALDNYDIDTNLYKIQDDLENVLAGF
jgi:hypothetical protein